jgi:hypothetical protein
MSQDDSVFPAAATSAEAPATVGRLRYSICTIVTKPAEYRRMLEGFTTRGFAQPECEFLYVDNSSGNRLDAFAAYNLFLQVARGAFILLCHQDVELLTDGRERLDEVIAELQGRDPNWGLFGNAGGVRLGKLAIRISGPKFDNVTKNGPFPVACQTLDENFIVVRRDANLALPRDRSGFHFYGTELCLFAEMLGWTAYVVDFHLLHHGVGELDSTFHEQLNHVLEKYATVLRPRWITTPCTDLLLTSSRILNTLGNRRIPHRLASIVAKFRERRRLSKTSMPAKPPVADRSSTVSSAFDR